MKRTPTPEPVVVWQTRHLPVRLLHRAKVLALADNITVEHAINRLIEAGLVAGDKKYCRKWDGPPNSDDELP